MNKLRQFSQSLRDSGVLGSARKREKTPELHLLTQRGDLTGVRLLIQSTRVDLDQLDVETQRTALHEAAQLGLDAILGELLDRGARCNTLDAAHCTPLHLAAAGGHVRCCQHLVGARNRDPTARRALIALPDARGATPLLVAAEYGHADVVQVLLQSGSHINESMENRVTAGHLAARGGHVRVLGTLAAAGFDLNTDTLDRHTLLHEAARHGRSAAVQYLVAAGVDPGRKNFDLHTAGDLARLEGHTHLLQLLQ